MPAFASACLSASLSASELGRGRGAMVGAGVGGVRVWQGACNRLLRTPPWASAPGHGRPPEKMRERA